jgi:hypothetical protein
MRWWYLMCGLTQEYAVVYAYNKKEAFKKLQSKREIETKDYKYWTVEELTPNSYDGVLYFY